jgi:hypothetical protein
MSVHSVHPIGCWLGCQAPDMWQYCRLTAATVYLLVPKTPSWNDVASTGSQEEHSSRAVGIEHASTQSSPLRAAPAAAAAAAATARGPSSTHHPGHHAGEGSKVIDGPSEPQLLGYRTACAHACVWQARVDTTAVKDCWDKM